MLSLFIVSLSFGSSLATKYFFLNNEPCMVRSTLIDLNPVELKHYPVIIILDKCSGSFNVLFPKVIVSYCKCKINL